MAAGTDRERPGGVVRARRIGIPYFFSWRFMAAGTDRGRPGGVVRAPRIGIPYLFSMALHGGGDTAGRPRRVVRARRSGIPYFFSMATHGGGDPICAPNAIGHGRTRGSADHGCRSRAPPNPPCSRPRWRGIELGASLGACRKAQCVPTYGTCQRGG
jgi:hypothetical protein